MIYLDYLFSISNSTNGTDQILLDTATTINAFIPMLLAFVFLTVFLGGINRQKSRIGSADYPMWSMIASLSILMISLVLSINPGLISLDWLVIVIVINIMSGVWFFFDKKSNEVF